MTKPAMRMKTPAVKTDNAGSFLTAMLESMQPERGVDAGFICTINAKNRTFFVRVIIIKWARCSESHGLSLLLNGTVFKNKFLCPAGGS
jgi:hypothetical protein